jgi:rSAM/selenodomain-associated transferase 1
MSAGEAIVQVAVMAKAPRAGLAKTRLAPVLGTEGAASLAARLLERAVDHAARAGVGPVVLAVTPDAGHEAFDVLAARHGIAIEPQGDGDLGDRMERVLSRGVSTHGASLVMGTDVPDLDADVIREAAAALADHDAVLVPAHDGGFVLLGLRRCPRGLLAGMTWSHEQVLDRTLARLAAAGLSFVQLPALADIDTPDDLRHLASGWLDARD